MEFDAHMKTLKQLGETDDKMKLVFQAVEDNIYSYLKFVRNQDLKNFELERVTFTQKMAAKESDIARLE